MGMVKYRKSGRERNREFCAGLLVRASSGWASERQRGEYVLPLSLQPIATLQAGFPAVLKGIILLPFLNRKDLEVKESGER